MYESVLASLLLGITAGVCPINFALVSPMLPALLRHGCRIRLASSFSLGMVVIFVPLGVGASLLGSALPESAARTASAVSGITMILIGLWALRAIRLPMKGRGFRLPSAGPFVYGLAYALATIGRGAPLVISAISLFIAEGNALAGALGMLCYSLGMGMPLMGIAAVMAIGKTDREPSVLRLSKLLEKATGIVLVAFGSYYLALSLLQ